MVANVVLLKDSFHRAATPCIPLFAGRDTAGHERSGQGLGFSRKLAQETSAVGNRDAGPKGKQCWTLTPLGSMEMLLFRLRGHMRTLSYKPTLGSQPAVIITRSNPTGAERWQWSLLTNDHETIDSKEEDPERGP